MGSLSCKGLEIPKRPDPFKYDRHIGDEEEADTKRPLVGTGVVRSWRHPPSTHPRRLSAAVVEAIGDVVKQWSLDVIEYDHGGNNDESNENSW
jgi:hypothetical protein